MTDLENKMLELIGATEEDMKPHNKFEELEILIYEAIVSSEYSAALSEIIMEK